MADPVFLALLYTHVIFVVAWLGATLYSNMLLLPMMAKLTPPTRAELSRVVVPRSFRYGIIMGSAALAAGVLLYGYINFLSKGSATSSSGLPFIQTGALLGLLGLIVFSIITNNLFKKMREASTAMSSAPIPPGASALGSTSVMTGLQNRLKVVGITGMILLVIVLALMIIGANI
jgi:uncharacterized membrane protein